MKEKEIEEWRYSQQETHRYLLDILSMFNIDNTTFELEENYYKILGKYKIVINNKCCERPTIFPNIGLDGVCVECGKKLKTK
jgi:hypothetical protein